MPGKSNKINRTANGACLGDDLLYRHLEKLTTAAESQVVEEHLISCNTCFHNFSTLARSAHAPATEAEKIELARLSKLTPPEQIRKILDYVEADGPAGERKEVDNLAITTSVWDKIRVVLDDFRLGTGHLWKPAVIGVSIILLLFLAGRAPYRAWQSRTLAASGLSYLIEQRPIASREEPRPSGGFKYAEFGGTRSETSAAAFAPARAELEKALQLNDKSAAAHHYLGTFYLLIENDLAKAQAEYLAALAQDSTNAAVRNDLGVIAFYQGRYSEAEKNFSLSLRAASTLAEPRYNLATLYQAQGRNEDAVRAWTEYLGLDADSQWAAVARARLELLQPKK